MRLILLSATAALFSFGAAQTPDFAKMTADREAVFKAQDWKAAQILTENQRDQIQQLLREDKLKTADEFFKAANVSGDPFGFYEGVAPEHELVLTAMLLKNDDAAKRLGYTWDRMMFSFGREQRFGSMFMLTDGKKVPINLDPNGPAPNLAATIKDPAAAREKAKTATNNAELQKLCDEDQQVRQGIMTPEKLKKMTEGDEPRKARVLELLKQNVPVTARDFYNCALVLQHGGEFRSYMMAHECIMAAAILGDTEAPWLVSRTWDRMLLSCGHRQRFGTQFSSAGLEWMDWNTGPSDTMRKLTRCSPLAKLKEDFEKIRKSPSGRH